MFSSQHFENSWTASFRWRATSRVTSPFSAPSPKECRYWPHQVPCRRMRTAHEERVITWKLLRRIKLGIAMCRHTEAVCAKHVDRVQSPSPLISVKRALEQTEGTDTISHRMNATSDILPESAQAKHQPTSNNQGERTSKSRQ